jgi:hypothetical protein
MNNTIRSWEVQYILFSEKETPEQQLETSIKKRDKKARSSSYSSKCESATITKAQKILTFKIVEYLKIPLHKFNPAQLILSQDERILHVISNDCHIQRIDFQK